MAASTTTQKARSRTRSSRPGRAKARAAHRPSRRSGNADVASARSSRPDPAITALLERMATAVTSGDGAAAATLFAYPATMVMGDSTQPLNDPGTVARFFGEAPRMYRERGIEQTFPLTESTEWLTPELALVRVRWPYIDADGNDTGDAETSVYVVRKGRGGPLVCSAIALGVESERRKAR
jgi:hypothetical protein